MTLPHACTLAPCVVLASGGAMNLQSQPRPALRARTGDAGFARRADACADECGAGLVDPRSTLRGLGLLQ